MEKYAREYLENVSKMTTDRRIAISMLYSSESDDGFSHKALKMLMAGHDLTVTFSNGVTTN